MNIDLIQNTLSKILSELNGLNELLKTEKNLLSESDFDKISEIADQKKQIITNIEINDSKFKAMLNSKEFVSTGKPIHDIVADCIPASMNLWVEIETLLKICKDKNSINGIILSNNRRYIRDSIAILQGRSNEVLTYGATGESIVAKSILNSPITV